jgi:hypothetical protein
LVVTVWLNAAGQVTGPPQPADFVFAAALTAIVTLTSTALTLLIVLRLIQCFLNWRRLAGQPRVFGACRGDTEQAGLNRILGVG